MDNNTYIAHFTAVVKIRNNVSPLLGATQLSNSNSTANVFSVQWKVQIKMLEINIQGESVILKKTNLLRIL